VVFGDAQTGQLEKANADKRASLQIVEACEKRDREAAKQITKKPWWAVF
jgi:DNA-binding GntR family transcriptional regulator